MEKKMVREAASEGQCGRLFARSVRSVAASRSPPNPQRSNGRERERREVAVEKKMVREAASEGQCGRLFARSVRSVAASRRPTKPQESEGRDDASEAQLVTARAGQRGEL